MHCLINLNKTYLMPQIGKISNTYLTNKKKVHIIRRRWKFDLLLHIGGIFGSSNREFTGYTYYLYNCCRVKKNRIKKKHQNSMGLGLWL